MKRKTTCKLIPQRANLISIVMATTISTGGVFAAQSLPNACPVDGCIVKIIDVKTAGEELELTFQANFTPDNAKNHFHVWWGENYTVKQVGKSAVTEHGVTQGNWHRHDDYPTYITTGAASTSVRGDAKTICVSAADRNHNILDITLYHCEDASNYL